MNRRTLLCAVGAATTGTLAGCIASLGGSDPDDSGGSGPDGSDEPDPGGPGSTGQGPATYPSLSVATDPVSLPDLSVDVSVVEGFDADSPARVRIAVENTGDREETPIFGATPPFTEHRGRQVDGAAAALLVPVDRPHMAEVIPGTPENDTWQATDDFAVNATAVQVPLSPGETVGRTYAFLAAPDSEGLPAGDYRFEKREYAGDGSWGFTVTVSY